MSSLGFTIYTRSALSSVALTKAATPGRILRLLASVGMVKQPGKDTFSADKMTHELASPVMESGVHLL